MLYRLCLKTSNYQPANIVINAPSRSALQHLIDDWKKDGFKLFTVLSAIVYYSEFLIISIDSEITSLSPNDTLLHWDHISFLSKDQMPCHA